MSAAEAIVSAAVTDALNRAVWVAPDGEISATDTDGDPTGRVVLLTATPSPDDRSVITVRVDPFAGSKVSEVKVLVSPARVIPEGETVDQSGAA